MQELTLESSGHRAEFTQQFAHAYVTRDSDGDTDLVLVDQAGEQAARGGHADAPVRQVMHIRVMWHPKRDQKADHSSASNATVHWYVMGNTPDSANQVLEYAGTAFVAVDPEDDASQLIIRNASVCPVACRGGLCDPVGACQIHGTVHADENRQRVLDVLSSVRTAVAAANGLPTNVSGAKPESPSSAAR